MGEKGEKEAQNGKKEIVWEIRKREQGTEIN